VFKGDVFKLVGLYKPQLELVENPLMVSIVQQKSTELFDDEMMWGSRIRSRWRPRDCLDQ
jgi:hypothetical protein